MELAQGIRGSQVEDWRATFDPLAGFFDRQEAFLEAVLDRDYVLYGGARGPGKSYALRWALIGLLIKWGSEGHTGVRVMLGCESYPELYERQLSKALTEFGPSQGRFHLGNKEFILRPELGGGVIAFRNLDDVHKYQGAEYAAIAIDEITRACSLRMFNTLRGSKRWPGIHDTKFMAATNPNGVYAPWVRGLWIESEFPEEMEYLRDQFVFVPGRARDNPFLSETYWEELNSLPEDLRRAWVDGDWYIPARGLVYSEFGQANVLEQEWEPYTEELEDGAQVAVPPFELAFDDGYIDPRAMYLIQRTGSRIYVFWEFWHSRMLEEESIADLREVCEAHGWPLPELAVGSPEAVELRERFRRADIPARSKPHKIVEGIKTVRQLIKDGQGHRALQVHPRCKNLIREFTQDYRYHDDEEDTSQERGSRNDETPRDKYNHGSDAVRYWCYMRARRGVD